MIDVYVLDSNFRTIGVIEAYRSLIWANRYRENGDCELYLDASSENIMLLAMGNYLMRLDDDMVCRIHRIEIETSATEGNYMIVTGIDVKSYLDQRIIWKTSACNGNVESFLRKLVRESLISPSSASRKISFIRLGTAAGFTETATEQISYANVGEKIRETCKTYSWGYKMILNSADQLEFILYKGSDRSSYVFFSDDYENLSSTKYSDSREMMTNVALIGGQDKGTARKKAELGTMTGADRYEEFIDADDIDTSIPYADLTAAYPGGSVITSGSSYYYRMPTLDLRIYDSVHKAWLQARYTGTVITVSGVEYFRMTNVNIAQLESSAPADDDSAEMLEVIYHSYLLARGEEQLSTFGEVETFEGSIVSDVSFIYKTDYFLGDVVYVENEYGIGANVRITEVIESIDENGYSVEPTFEYIS